MPMSSLQKREWIKYYLSICEFVVSPVFNLPQNYLDQIEVTEFMKIGDLSEINQPNTNISNEK